MADKKQKSFTARFFKSSKPKSPEDLIRSLREELAVLETRLQEGKSLEKVHEELGESFERAKTTLYGEGEAEPSAEACMLLTLEASRDHFIRMVVRDLINLDFETRKDASQVVCNLMRQPVSGRFPCADYLRNNTDLIDFVLKGYESPSTDIVLISGSILREVARHAELAMYILYSPGFSRLFDYVESASFEVASDAFATLKELLTRHKSVASSYLNDNYDQFLELYNRLLQSPNYLTRRQSIKLLADLLLDPSNAATAQRYVEDPKNLRMTMTLLKDQGKSIQLEAFHVFKIFVANQNRPVAVTDMLSANQAKLVKFFADFTSDRDDTQFETDKAQIIKEIEELPPSAARSRRISSDDNLVRRASQDDNLGRRVSSQEDVSVQRDTIPDASKELQGLQIRGDVPPS